MATLTGRAPKDTYKDLLQISNSNSGIDATLRTIEDGEGTSSTLQLSTTTTQVTATMGITGVLTATAGIVTGGVIRSDTDGTDDLGTTSIRFANVYTDNIGDSGQALTILNDISFSVDNPEILGGHTNGVMYLSPSTANALGGNITLFGDTHATRAGDIEFRDDASVVGVFDASAVQWNFQGASVITTGVANAATFEPTGDTSAGDNAAMGYTATEGVILTGQGSVNDVTIKNDTDGTALSVPTGTNNVLFGDSIAIATTGVLHFNTFGDAGNSMSYDGTVDGPKVTGNFGVSGDTTLTGSLSKGSGSFKISHPLPAMTDTHYLVNSFLEGPRADLIHRGQVVLVAGAASVNIDTASGYTEGTFDVLCREVQCFTTNEDGWTAVRGALAGNILIIEAQDNTCTDTINWMVIGERKDPHMIETSWTDANGRVIVEPEK